MNRSPQSPTLQVSLLGDFRLIHDEQLVTSVNTPRLQSLLTYLVLHRGAPQSRHHLAFTLWPDSTEAQALTNLRNLLYHLRRALPDADDFLHIDGQTVQWRTGTSFALDVAEFEGALARGERSQQDGDKAGLQSSLEEAAVLYRGDLLPSCYADWILPERERLRSSFVRTLERLVLLLEDEREYQSAISYAERLLRHDPLHEATYRRLMRLHALMRDRAGALRVYHTCTTVLQRELAVDPSPATREMYDRLLNADRPLGHGTPPATPIGPAAALQLIGRQHEWLRLREAWQTTSTGRSHFALVAGEAGIGKTRLVEELIQWAGRQGITTAATRCYAAEGVLAYGPVVSWLRSHPLPPLEPVWRSELTRILPELLVQDPDISPPGPLTEGWQRQRFFEALARAILPPTQPLLLSIDDLHWCDRETLEWLHYLLRSAPKAQLLVVGTLRPEETDENHPLASLVRALRHRQLLTEIELGPLSEAETTALAESVSGRKIGWELSTCLYRETEGNPLFVVETARTGLPSAVHRTEAGSFVCVPHPLPSRIKDALIERLAQLSPAARDLVGVAATIGREFTLDVLAEASDLGVNEDTLIRAVDELWQRRIVREQGVNAYDFSHNKLREVAHTSLSTARGRLLHRRVALALETVYAHDLDRMSGQIAAHYEQGGQLEQAVPYYRRAAKAAQQVYATDEAVSHFQRALALLETTATSKDGEDRRLEAKVQIQESLSDVLKLSQQRGKARAAH